MKTIPLTKGYEAIVDDGDYWWLSKLKWRVVTTHGGEPVYAVTGNGSIQLFFMHRILLGLAVEDPRQTDHINHNTLDNRRENLRICNHSQNQANQKPSKRGTSSYKGVSLNKNTGKWYAKICHKGHQKNLGEYIIEEEAAKAYDKAALDLFGEFACLNLPNGMETR